MNHRIYHCFLSVVLVLIVLAGFGILKSGQWQPLIMLSAVLALWLYCAWVNWFRPNAWLGPLLFVLSWSIFPFMSVISHQVFTWSADALLLRFDAWLWHGQTLAAYLQYENTPRFADVISACYFFFYVLMLGSVTYYSRQRHAVTGQAFFNGILLIYLIGFMGYIAFPAQGPAFTSLPQHAGGGIITQWVTHTVNQGVTGMDVFPSLHAALSIFVVGFLLLNRHFKLGLMIAPIVLGTVFATIFLRYHYGIDVLIGIVLAAITLKISQTHLNAVASHLKS